MLANDLCHTTGRLPHQSPTLPTSRTPPGPAEAEAGVATTGVGAAVAAGATTDAAAPGAEACRGPGTGLLPTADDFNPLTPRSTQVSPFNLNSISRRDHQKKSFSR